MGAQSARKTLSLLVAGMAATFPLHAAESAVEPQAHAGAALVAAFPAMPSGDCADCPDTLHAAHGITYISRLAFPHGSALLTREAKGELLRMLVELESFAVIEHVEIVGHADPSGPEKYNRWLSEVRAKRVQDYFAQRGVDPRKVSVHGAGSGEPLPGAIDPSEHRRIEVRVTLRPFL